MLRLAVRVLCYSSWRHATPTVDVTRHPTVSVRVRSVGWNFSASPSQFRKRVAARGCGGVEWPYVLFIISYKNRCRSRDMQAYAAISSHASKKVRRVCFLTTPVTRTTLWTPISLEAMRCVLGSSMWPM